MSRILGERRGGDRSAAAPQLLPAATSVAAVLSAAAGGFLLARRLGDAFPQPPGPAAVAAVCGAGLLIVAVVDRARPPAAAPLAAILARLGLVLGVAAVTLPLRPAAPGGMIASAAAILVAAGTALAPLVRRESCRIGGRSIAARPPAPAPAGTDAPPPLAGPIGGAAACPASPPATGDTSGDILQRFERRGLLDGGEQVDGMVRVTVPRGTRLGWAHVGFCPPFPATPAVDVATGYDGVEAIVAAAEVLPWGVRVEVRLDEPAEETIDVPVELVARTAA